MASWDEAIAAGRAALAVGDLTVARARFEAAISAAREGAALGPEASACGFLAQTLLQADEAQEAAEQARRAHEIATRLGDESAIGHFASIRDAAERHARPEAERMRALFGEGGAELARGEPAGAAVKLEEAADLARSLGEARYEAHARAMLAQSRLLLGLATTALPEAERAAALARGLGEAALVEQIEHVAEQARAPGIELSLAKAAAAIEAGRARDAVGILRPLLVRGAKAKIDEAWIHGLVAKAHLMLEELSLAAVHAERAVDIANEAGDADAARAFGKLLGRADGDVS